MKNHFLRALSTSLLFGLAKSESSLSFLPSKSAIASTATVISVVNGGLVSLFPKQTLDLYGGPQSGLDRVLVQRMGTAILDIGVLGAFAARNKKAAAIGSSMVWITEILRSFKGNGQNMYNMNPLIATLATILHGSVIGVAVCRPELLDNVLKFAGVAIFVASLLSVHTATSPLMHGFEITTAPSQVICRQVGFVASGVGLFYLALGCSLDSRVALGLAFSPMFVASFLAMFVTHDHKITGVMIGPQIGYLVYTALVSGTLVFS